MAVFSLQEKESRKRKGDDDLEVILIEKKPKDMPEHEAFEEDLDYAIALSLQEQEGPTQPNSNTSLDEGETKIICSDESLDHTIALSLQNSPSLDAHRSHDNKSWDLKRVVDPSFELEDPHPNIHNLFEQFDVMFFNSTLANAGVAVQWGPRMTLCAGLCCYEGRGGFCSIRLSAPLLKLRPRKDLVETLLHEMIHALLFVTANNKDRDSHGPEFKSHMHRINKLTGANITVYHSFHDEVNLYRQHWWKCSGPCQYRKPFYGMVRRAINRAPSKHDPWWAEHQYNCGGTFMKIKEPEGYSSKKKGKRKESSKKITPSETKTHSDRSTSTKTESADVQSRADVDLTGERDDRRTHTDTTETHSSADVQSRADVDLTGERDDRRTHTDTTETHSSATVQSRADVDLTGERDDKREKMLRAAEQRILAKGCSNDIRKFMTPPCDSTHTVLVSTPSVPNSSSSPILIDSNPKSNSVSLSAGNSRQNVERRTCPVCGRDDIPKATIHIHITFCLEEMELESESED